MVYDIEIPAKATVTKRFLLACARQEQLGPLIEKYKASSREEKLLERSAAWFKERAVSLGVPDMPWLDRETAWHGTYMLASMFADEYHGLHRIPV